MLKLIYYISHFIVFSEIYYILIPFLFGFPFTENETLLYNYGDSYMPFLCQRLIDHLKMQVAIIDELLARNETSEGS